MDISKNQWRSTGGLPDCPSQKSESRAGHFYRKNWIKAKNYEELEEKYNETILKLNNTLATISGDETQFEDCKLCQFPFIFQGIALIQNTSSLLSNLSARPGFSLVNLGSLSSKQNEFKISISFRQHASFNFFKISRWTWFFKGGRYLKEILIF